MRNYVCMLAALVA